MVLYLDPVFCDGNSWTSPANLGPPFLSSVPDFGDSTVGRIKLVRRKVGISDQSGGRLTGQ